MAYVWPLSVRPGDEIAVHARGPAGAARVEIARVGATRRVLDAVDTRVSPQELPPDADATGCDWPVVVRWRVPDEAVSGYHEVVVRSAEASTSTDDSGGPMPDAIACFVVRAGCPDPARPMVVLSTNTWNAYNDIAGTNLYTGGTHVSFLRPMAPGLLRKPGGPGSRVAVVGPPDPRMRAHVGHIRTYGLSAWSGSAGWPGWEAPFASWAESNGIVVDYAVNADLELVPDLLEGRRLYVSVGHDEYWSASMRDAVESFVAAGGNAAFFSGNVAYWQVRLEDDGRTMVGYKQQFEADPVYGTPRERELTSIWSDRLIGRPETALTGLSFVRGGYHRIGRAVGAGAGGYEVHRPDHWLFEGTGLARGDLLGAGSTIVGYECDGCALALVDGLPVPTGEDGCPPGTVVLATAPASGFTRDNAARPVPDDQLSEVEFNAWRVLGASDAATSRRLEAGHAVLAVRDGEGGRGTVVATGCTDWVWGLAGGDAQVETITRTVLDRLSRPA